MVRYLFAGGFAFLVDYGLYWMMIDVLRIPYLVAGALGFAFGVVLTYLLNTLWVFERRAIEDRRREFAIFLSINLVGVAVHLAALWFFTESVGIDARLSKFPATACTVAYSFASKKCLLFR